MPLWLQVAVGVAVGALLAFMLLIAAAWVVALGVWIADRVRLRRRR